MTQQYAALRYGCFARFTVSSTDYAIGTDAALRSSVWHEAGQGDYGHGLTRLDMPLRDAFRAGGVVSGERFELRITEAPGGPLRTAHAAGAFDGISVDVEVVLTVTADDGSETEQTVAKRLTVAGTKAVPLGVVLSLVDLEDEKLNQLYPSRLYSADDFADLLTADSGRAVPRPVGTALKLEAALVDDTNHRFCICEVDAATTATVNTVYRNGRIVDASEYTVSHADSPFRHCRITFGSEQVDFNGNRYRIEADVTYTPAGDPRNVANEIERLLTVAGVSVDASSFAAAEAVATAASMLVDCDHGRAGQRRIRAIVEDLLVIARATLTRNSAGAYVIVQDVAASSSLTLSEQLGDTLEITEDDNPPKPASVGISYRPQPDDPNKLQHSITRAVTGGTQGDAKPLALRYLRDHTAADKLLCYHALRRQYGRRVKGKALVESLSIGQVVTLDSPIVLAASGDWRIVSLQCIPLGFAFEAEQYDASVYAYSAGTLPSDATDGYQPDYSKTPPAAPSALTITASATQLAGDGPLTATVTADCTPPSANWQQIKLAAIHNTTAEIVMADADAIGGGDYGATLTGLRPGEVYQLHAWAVNSNNVRGVSQSTFNATAIGGGASVTTFTAAGYATLPSNVSSISVAQGIARTFHVSWAAVTTANLKEYVLRRRIGVSPYVEIWRGKTLNYIDRDVAYGSNYQYGVKAVDTYGNESTSWRTSGSSSLTAGTVVGGSSSNDIGNSTVATYNRTSVTTVSTTYTNPTITGQQKTLAHSLGKTPTVLIDTGSKGNVWASVYSRSSTQVVINIFSGTDSHDYSGGANTGNSAPTNPHSHTLPAVIHQYAGVGSTVSVDLW